MWPCGETYSRKEIWRQGASFAFLPVKIVSISTEEAVALNWLKRLLIFRIHFRIVSL